MSSKLLHFNDDLPGFKQFLQNTFIFWIPTNHWCGRVLCYFTAKNVESLTYPVLVLGNFEENELLDTAACPTLPFDLRQNLLFVCLRFLRFLGLKKQTNKQTLCHLLAARNLPCRGQERISRGSYTKTYFYQPGKLDKATKKNTCLIITDWPLSRLMKSL